MGNERVITGRKIILTCNFLRISLQGMNSRFKTTRFLLIKRNQFQLIVFHRIRIQYSGC